MNTELEHQSKTDHAPFDAEGRSALRRVDALDEPARPLGPKRAALHDRRQQSPSGRSARPARGPEPVAAGKVVMSSDAALTFLIFPTHSGVLVKRTHCPSPGPRIVHIMKFDCVERFDRWCTCEPIRFADPLLYDQLLRSGHDALYGSA